MPDGDCTLCFWRTPSGAADCSNVVPNHALAAPQNALLQYVLDTVPQPAVPPPDAVAALGSAGAASSSRYSRAQALGPHCGDGVCQAGESCATCAFDCKQVCSSFLTAELACWTLCGMLFCHTAGPKDKTLQQCIKLTHSTQIGNCCTRA